MAAEPEAVEEAPDIVFPPTEHPLLDGDLADYQHAPETAGLDYNEELTDDEATPQKKGAKKDAD